MEDRRGRGCADYRYGVAQAFFTLRAASGPYKDFGILTQTPKPVSLRRNGGTVETVPYEDHL
jgi:hypothetical protein